VDVHILQTIMYCYNANKWSGGIAPRILTVALDGGEWSALHAPVSLPSGKDPPVSIG